MLRIPPGQRALNVTERGGVMTKLVEGEGAVSLQLGEDGLDRILDVMRKEA